MKKFFYLSLLAWCFVTVTSAQEQIDIDYAKLYANYQKKYIITIEPLQLINWCFRLNFETRLGDGSGSIQISPAVYFTISADHDEYYYDIEGNYHTNRWYYSGDGIHDEPFNHLQGAGLEVIYKRYINPARTWYFAGGLSYSHLSIDYRGRHMDSYVEDGLDYYEYNSGNYIQHLNRAGANIYAGYLFPFRRKHFVLDVYAGIGYRQVFYDENKPKFNETPIISYGYKGPVFLAGIKIGFWTK